MKLVDVHCHLESREFSTILDSVISDARDSGLVKLITSSITIDQWEQSKALAEKYMEVEFTTGVHPWYASEKDLDVFSRLEEAGNTGAIAIGEIGLDKKISSPDFDIQLTVFEEQMRFAVTRNMPVVIHCRGAFNELAIALKKTGIPSAGGIIHSFSGSMQIAEKMMEMGLSFSMGGTLTYRNSNKRAEVLKKIYPHNFLLETDSPDISPVGTEKPNVPSNILLNLEAAGEILGVRIEEIAEKTTENAVRIFKLKI